MSANHERNNSAPQKYGLRRRTAAVPAPTATAADIVNAPFIVTNQDQVSDCAPRTFGVSRRIACVDGPSPTVLAGGEATAGRDAPLIERRVNGDASSTYAMMLDRELPREPSTRRDLWIASLFCGCGGVDLGFRSAGFGLSFATDYAEKACASFEKNLGHAARCCDVRELYGSDIGEVDVLTGGFPCVTFSMAGRRAGVTDDLNGKLYLEMCRLISEARPRYFVAENVRGMLSANGGNAVKLVLASFLRLGYRTSYELVNMAEHGVPQTRQRVVFVGVRLDQWHGSFVFPRRTHRLAEDAQASKRLPLAVSLREAIAGLGEPGEKVLENWHADSWRNHHTRVAAYAGSRPRRPADPAHSQIASNPNLVVIAARNSDFANPMIDSRRPAPAVTASRAPEVVEVRRARRAAPFDHTDDEPCPSVTSVQQPALRSSNHEQNNAPVSPTYRTSARRARSDQPAPTAVGHNGGNVHPFIDGVRRMTVRECARVQSFPDWFEFVGSMADCYRQVGNAVPPLYAKRLALALIEYDARKMVER